MIIASISLVLAVGHNASAHTEHDRILVLDDWEDFEFRDYANWFWPDPDDGDVCYKLSDKVACDILGYGYYSGCGYFGDEDLDKLSEYDEIHIIFPDGVKYIDGYVFDSWGDGLGSKITYIKIPQSVERVGRQMLNDIGFDTKVYCECSEAFANEHYWPENWNEGYGYDEEQDEYVYKPINVVWDCNKTITFDTDGGNNIAEQTVCVDSLVTKPTDPEKDGYVFKGWFDNNGDEYDFSAPVTGDMNLTAQWEVIPEQPEPSNPEQPTEPETPDTDTETTTEQEVKNDVNVGLIAGGVSTIVAGLITVGTTLGLIIKRRRR